MGGSWLRFAGYAALLLALVSSSSAEAAAQNMWWLYVEGGLQRATLSRPDGSPAELRLFARSGRVFGLAARRGLNGIGGGRLSVETGWSIAARGTRWRIPSGSGSYARAEARVRTLDVPVLLHLSLARFGPFRAEATTGVIGSRPGSDDVYDLSDGSIIGRVSLRELSMLGVIGAQLSVEEGIPVRLTMRYQHGLTEATRGAGSDHVGLAVAAGVRVLRW